MPQEYEGRGARRRARLKHMKKRAKRFKYEPPKHKRTN